MVIKNIIPWKNYKGKLLTYQKLLMLPLLFFIPLLNFLELRFLLLFERTYNFLILAIVINSEIYLIIKKGFINNSNMNLIKILIILHL